MRGVRNLWRQLNREGIVVARCTAARLLCELLSQRGSGPEGEEDGPGSDACVPGGPSQSRVFRSLVSGLLARTLWVTGLTYVAT